MTIDGQESNHYVSHFLQYEHTLSALLRRSLLEVMQTEREIARLVSAARWQGVWEKQHSIEELETHDVCIEWRQCDKHVLLPLEEVTEDSFVVNWCAVNKSESYRCIFRLLNDNVLIERDLEGQGTISRWLRQRPIEPDTPHNPYIQIRQPNTSTPMTQCSVAACGSRIGAIIITDSDNSDVEMHAAVTIASNENLAIVIVGVGDGPFTTLEMLDDHVPERSFGRERAYGGTLSDATR